MPRSSGSGGLLALLAKTLRLIFAVPIRAVGLLQEILVGLLGWAWDVIALFVPRTFHTIRLLLGAVGRTLLSVVWAAAYAVGKFGEASSAVVKSFKNQEMLVIALVLLISFLLLRS